MSLQLTILSLNEPFTLSAAGVVGFDRLVMAVSEMDRMVVLTLVKHGDNEAPVYITVSTMDGSAQGIPINVCAVYILLAAIFEVCFAWYSVVAA